MSRKFLSLETRAVGWEALGYAVLEQAIEDYKYLCAARVIRRGRTVRRWPAGKRYLHWYSCRSTATMLLYFFNGKGLEIMLAATGSSLTAMKVRKGLKL